MKNYGTIEKNTALWEKKWYYEKTIVLYQELWSFYLRMKKQW